jgi:hypothetical protein
MSETMSNPASKSRDESSWKLRRLQGRPLTSRGKWLTIKAIYIVACIVGVIAVLMFTHGLVLAIGLAIMAFFIGGFLELFALRYDDYQGEWKQANRADRHCWRQVSSKCLRMSFPNESGLQKCLLLNPPASLDSGRPADGSGAWAVSPDPRRVLAGSMNPCSPAAVFVAVAGVYLASFPRRGRRRSR